LPDRSYPARAVISRLLPFWEKEVRFPYFCRNNNNLKKLVDCLEKCLIYRHIRRFAD
jgi:hypothetical protein